MPAGLQNSCQTRQIACEPGYVRLPANSPTGEGLKVEDDRIAAVAPQAEALDAAGAGKIDAGGRYVPCEGVPHVRRLY